MVLSRTGAGQQHSQRPLQGSLIAPNDGLVGYLHKKFLHHQNSFIGVEDKPPNVLEQWLQADVEQKPFLQNYRTLKALPGNEVLKALTRFYTFDSSSANVLPEISTGNLVHTGSNASPETFSQVLTEFGCKIRARSVPSLQICMLSLKLSASLRPILFKFKDKVYCSAAQLNRKYEIPSRSILAIVQKEWDSSKTWTINTFTGHMAVQVRQFKLPSKLARSRGSSSGGNDSDTQDSIISIILVSNAPLYKGDFYEYIWQRQAQFPPAVRLVCRTSEVDNLGSKKVFITIDSDEESADGERCAEILEALSQNFTAVLPLTGSDEPICSLESAHLAVSFALLAVLADKTSDFVNSTSQIVLKLKYQGRTRPSSSKLHYQSHLEDARQIAVSSVEDALELLVKIEALELASSTAAQSLRIKFSDLKKDIESLREELATIKVWIDDLQVIANTAKLKAELDLRQIEPTYILTFLAAIYFPFSFMTSLYGMNISDPLWSSKNSTDTTNIIARDIAPLPDNSSTLSIQQTSAIVAAIQSSGSHVSQRRKTDRFILTIRDLSFVLVHNDPGDDWHYYLSHGHWISARFPYTVDRRPNLIWGDGRNPKYKIYRNQQTPPEMVRLRITSGTLPRDLVDCLLQRYSVSTIDVPLLSIVRTRCRSRIRKYILVHLQSRRQGDVGSQSSTRLEQDEMGDPHDIPLEPLQEVVTESLDEVVPTNRRGPTRAAWDDDDDLYTAD
ncbi:uncharacterized protein RCO7_02522 [Rhynchosporium graminicola]|uniref:Uncharacterized protein n=1 Tax=Rhynchosporium graminicola TaxID=2792576 RepID=A0A1E1JUW2_9HELO|nr:uncharacterized protein RCO7_02522 [Rhynchosporium commune]